MECTVVSAKVSILSGGLNLKLGVTRADIKLEVLSHVNTCSVLKIDGNWVAPLVMPELSGKAVDAGPSCYTN